MNKRVFIIAEAGVNHNGDIALAKKMIEVAKECGADAVKFQTFKAEKLVSKLAPKAQYQTATTSSSESQFEMIRKLELNEDDHKELIKYSEKHNIEFISTPFDTDSIDLLGRLNVKILKISSGDINNYPYLKRIAGLKKKIILSTGMSTLEEVREAIGVLTNNGTPLKDITVLHCNTEYPTPYEDVNLKAMVTIKKSLGVRVGYSDHTLGLEIPVAAVSLGAEIIEKHFTLDSKMSGPDHKASSEPDEFRKMVSVIRNVEVAMGNGEKKPSQSEEKNIKIVRKSIVALTSIRAGETFTEKNIAVKRPGTGISPMLWNDIIGQKAKKDFVEDELIEI